MPGLEVSAVFDKFMKSSDVAAPACGLKRSSAVVALGVDESAVLPQQFDDVASAVPRSLV